MQLEMRGTGLWNQQRRRSWAMMTVTLLLVSACGASATDQGTADGSTSTDQENSEASPDSEDESEVAAEGGTATFTIDSKDTVVFSMDPVEYSPKPEVFSDVTFESCTANFFGIGMFSAIGYPVDSDGALLLADNGDIAGSAEIEIPPDDWQAKGLDDGDLDVEFESDALGLDLRMASPERAAELAPDADHSWAISDNGVIGTGVFTDVRQDVYIVEFEATCG